MALAMATTTMWARTWRQGGDGGGETKRGCGNAGDVTTSAVRPRRGAAKRACIYAGSKTDVRWRQMVRIEDNLTKSRQRGTYVESRSAIGASFSMLYSTKKSNVA